MTARFNQEVAIIKDNYINAEIGSTVQGGGGDFYIEVWASQPLSSDIILNFGARGSYWEPSNIEGERPVSRDFDVVDRTTLKAGESSWSIKVFIGSGGWFDGYDGGVNWMITFTEFTDSKYNYKQGTTTGIDVP